MQSGASGCEKSVVKCFPRVPRALGLYCSCRAAQVSKGNFQKTFYTTFFTTWCPRLQQSTNRKKYSVAYHGSGRPSPLQCQQRRRRCTWRPNRCRGRRRRRQWGSIWNRRETRFFVAVTKYWTEGNLQEELKHRVTNGGLTLRFVDFEIVCSSVCPILLGRGKLDRDGMANGETCGTLEWKSTKSSFKPSWSPCT